MAGTGASKQWLKIISAADARDYSGSAFDVMLRNYTSEKFWDYYFDETFRKELDLYGKEGILTEYVGSPNNHYILEQFEHPTEGIFSKVEKGKTIKRESNDYFILNHANRDVNYKAADFQSENSQELSTELETMINKAATNLLNHIAL